MENSIKILSFNYLILYVEYEFVNKLNLDSAELGIRLQQIPIPIPIQIPTPLFPPFSPSQRQIKGTFLKFSLSSID